MPDREKVIKDWESILSRDPLDVPWDLIDETLTLLKEQEGYVSVRFSWLVKFCSHIDFKESLTDEEREKEWKSKLKQQFDIDV